MTLSLCRRGSLPSPSLGVSFAAPAGNSSQQPVLSAARLVAAAAASLPSLHGNPSEEAAAKGRQQAVLRSLKPFVQLGSVSAGGEQQLAAQQQLTQELLGQCQVMMSRCGKGSHHQSWQDRFHSVCYQQASPDGSG